MSSDTALFLAGLVNWYLSLPSMHANEVVLTAKHAFLTFLVTLLSSQLVYAKRQVSQPASYTDMQPSPAVDVLFQLPPDTTSALIRSLLREVTASYHWLPVPLPLSYVSQLLQVIWSDEAASLDQLRDQLGAAAMTVSLLLLNYGGLPNPFSNTQLGEVSEVICVKALDLLEEQEVLLLLFTLVRDNAGFRETFIRSGEQELYLPQLCEYVYSVELARPSPRLLAVLGLLLVLSTEDAYMRFLNREVRLGGLTWLPEYNSAGMSVGSLLFLTALRVFRDNVSVGNGYLHTITVALLYNLSRNAFALHEVAAQSLTSTLVSLWRRGHDSELLVLFLDLYASVLESTLPCNPWVLYMTLREADTFRQMQASGVSEGIVPQLLQMLEELLASIQGEDVEKHLREKVKTHRFPRQLKRQTLTGVQRFEVGDKASWERWVVPQVWEAACSKALVLVKPAGALW